MRSDLGSFLDDDHVRFRRKLLEPDRRCEAGGARADDHDVELHRLAGGQLLGAHALLQSETARARSLRVRATVTTNRNGSTPFTPAGQEALLQR